MHRYWWVTVVRKLDENGKWPLQNIFFYHLVMYTNMIYVSKVDKGKKKSVLKEC